MKYIVAFFTAIVGFLFSTMVGGYMLMFIGVEAYLPPIVLENTREYSEAVMELVGRDIGPGIVGILFLFLFLYLYSLYYRLNKKKKDTFDRESINPPFVLYLRSFKADEVTKKRISFSDIRNEEEALVEVLSDIAPVYAIGDPRDKKMPLGASRIYVDDEHWKETVIDMARKSVLVVLRLGETDSFWWEVEMVVKNLPLEKVLFVVPAAKTFNNVASLYEILLEHGIDIKGLEVNIERKRQGSISSILYFDDKGNAKTTEVKVGRFTRLIMSYENTLRNSLADFRSRYGLSTKKVLTIKKARILQIFLFAYILLIGGSMYFKDKVSLKYQMPYELVEECVKDSAFVSKYSDEVNGTNLCWSIVESRLGSFALSDEEYLFLATIELTLYWHVSWDELEEIDSSFENKLLMVKKYHEFDDYSLYVQLLSEAAKIAVNNPIEVKETIKDYQLNAEYLPQWVYDLDELEDIEQRIDIIFSHFEDEGIADILKTMESLTIDLEKLP